MIDFNNLVVYLCGPMDYAKDAGVGWRKEATEKLLELGLKENFILNPCRKPLSHLGASLSEEQLIVNRFRDNKDYKGLAKIMRQIMHVDLRLVDKADVLIVNLSDSERTVGTIHEIVIASLAKKPIYIIDNKGPGHVSGWLFGLVGEDRIFTTLDEVISQLKNVKEGGKLSDKDIKQYLVFDFEKRDS